MKLNSLQIRVVLALSLALLIVSTLFLADESFLVGMVTLISSALGFVVCLSDEQKFKNILIKFRTMKNTLKIPLILIIIFLLGLYAGALYNIWDNNHLHDPAVGRLM